MGSIIQSIRKHRASVMGAAIVWVVFYHSGIVAHFPKGLCFPLEIGYGGVDIFLFLSGFGLYHSLNRDPDAGHFLRRRAEKIYPAFVPVLLAWMVKTTGRGAGFLYWARLVTGNLTGASFWLGTANFNWYVLTLPVFYFAAPFIKKQLDDGGWRRCAGLLAWALVLSVAFWDEFRLVAVSRVPVFVLGMYLGKMACAGKEPSGTLSFGCMVLGFLLLYGCLRFQTDNLWMYGLWWYPFILVTPGLVFLLSALMDRMASAKLGALIVGIFRKLGEASFEIYLIHIPVFEHLERKLQLTLWQCVGAMAACILAGLLYHRVIEAGQKYFHQATVKTK